MASVLMVLGVGAVASPALAGDQSSGTTTITMRVTGCDGCSITPTQGLRLSKNNATTWVGTPVTVTDGRAVMVVPTRRTAGMSFTIDLPKPVQIGAKPVITTQYQGSAPGSVVSRDQARAATDASACWSGTSASATTLEVRVGRVVMKKFPGPGLVRVPLAWVVPTLDAPGGFDEAFKGVLGTQEGVGAFCTLR
jgi:hypothetical protein